MPPPAGECVHSL